MRRKRKTTINGRHKFRHKPFSFALLASYGMANQLKTEKGAPEKEETNQKRQSQSGC